MNYEKLFQMPTGCRDLFLKVKFSSKDEYKAEIRRQYKKMMSEVRFEKDLYSIEAKETMVIKILSEFYCKSTSVIYKWTRKG